MHYRYLLIALLILFCQQAIAAVFVVTSNADSGPGTLREALAKAAANGYTEKDYINFNLPDVSEAGRTITMLSSLPDISSNLVIDGTTQQGSYFGVTKSKVKIFNKSTDGLISGTLYGSGVDLVEIYGLWLRDNDPQAHGYGIQIKNYDSIKIGAPEKGNYFENTNLFFDKGKTLTFQSNICFTDLAAQDQYMGGIGIFSCDKLIIGGSAATGNMIAGFLQIILTNTINNDFDISYNKMGTNIEGTDAPVGPLEYPRITIEPSYSNNGMPIDAPVNGIIKNNLFANVYANDILLLYASSGNLKIQGNGINTDITGSLNLNLHNQNPSTTGIAYTGGAKVLIGGDAPSEKNAIAYCQYGISASPTDDFVVTKNSIFCFFYQAMATYLKPDLPFVKINAINIANVSGTATPGSIIELFYADCACDLPGPKVYFASAKADGTGNWTYDGPVNGTVIASAIFKNSTSDFSAPYSFININDVNAIKKTAGCGKSNGSIINVKIKNLVPGTESYTYTWKDGSGQEVGHQLDLVNVPSGTYTLEVKGSGCGSAFSKPITLESTDIVFDYTNLKKTNAGCNKATGSIKGITAPQATKFEWRDANNNLVGTKADLDGVPAGAYSLTASNESGCSKTTNPYEILEIPGTVFPSTYTVNHIDACYGAPNGALQVNQNILIKAVRWVNAAGVDVAMHHGATGLPAGSYKLYLTDQNGCESYYNTYQVDQLPELKVTDNGQTGNEQCGLKSGYVSNVTVAGGLPPYTYTWLDASGASIGTTNSISNLAAGAYTLNIADSRCGSINVNYQIQNITQDLAAPSVSDIQVCSPGDAILLVNNAAADVVYRLYDQADNESPLTEQTGGRFKIAVTTNRSFFVSQVSGTCESPKTEVKVSVGLSPLSIANTFTPNGDGSNDYWKISNIESYPAAVVQVFNRNGQKLFESKGYTTPFNGTYNGKALPVGTYYYIINLNKNCNLLSGSLTILR